VICDGHHVHPASLRIAQRAKAAGKLFLVTDAMATVGAQDASFSLYGETISATQGKLVNAEGKLAGSCISMADAVRYATHCVGFPLAESLRMASLYPAQCMGIENHRGRLQPQYRADLVCLNAALEVTDTWLGGEHQQHRLGSGSSSTQRS
jgi:N-acetylglucosamine-6-phosphate deacetylase